MGPGGKVWWQKSLALEVWGQKVNLQYHPCVSSMALLFATCSTAMEWHLQCLIERCMSTETRARVSSEHCGEVSEHLNWSIYLAVSTTTKYCVSAAQLTECKPHWALWPSTTQKAKVRAPPSSLSENLGHLNYNNKKEHKGQNSTNLLSLIAWMFHEYISISLLMLFFLSLFLSYSTFITPFLTKCFSIFQTPYLNTISCRKHSQTTLVLKWWPCFPTMPGSCMAYHWDNIYLV